MHVYMPNAFIKSSHSMVDMHPVGRPAVGLPQAACLLTPLKCNFVLYSVQPSAYFLMVIAGCILIPWHLDVESCM